MEVAIRSENEKDYNVIREVNNIAFQGNIEGALIDKLRALPKFIHELSLAAEIDSKIIGHILFYPIIIKDDDKEYTTLALAPMSVLPEYQKEGIGSKLILEGFKKALELGFESILVLGHPKYYTKFGFIKAEEFNIIPPYDDWKSAFFVKELKENALKGIKGKAVYPKEYLEV
jgi:putative acetyltransferase